MTKKFKIPTGYIEVESEAEYNMLTSLIKDGYAEDYHSAKKVLDEISDKILRDLEQL